MNQTKHKITQQKLLKASGPSYSQMMRRSTNLSAKPQYTRTIFNILVVCDPAILIMIMSSTCFQYLHRSSSQQRSQPQPNKVPLSSEDYSHSILQCFRLKPIPRLVKHSIQGDLWDRLCIVSAVFCTVCIA